MSPDLLLILVYKCTAVSLLVLLLVYLLRDNAAHQQVRMLQLGTSMVMLSPLVGALLPGTELLLPREFAAIIPRAGGTLLDRAWPADIARVLLLVYATVTLFLLARIALGLCLLARWTRTARPVACAAWSREIASRVARNVRVLVSDRIDAPLSWGLVNPVILLDRATLSRPEHAAAVLAHEMSHIRRKDGVTLVQTHLALAVFWPIVTLWALRALTLQRMEEAADMDAVREVDRFQYAAALVACAEQRRCPAAAAANRFGLTGGLLRRVSLIVSEPARPNRWRLALFQGLSLFYLATSLTIATAAICASG